tara:strand:- start:178 stop:480 length:303 start_codon:yes stop_codon:yes gene_type:complete
MTQKNEESSSIKPIILKVLTGEGSELDKIDVVSHLVVEKMSMTETMTDHISKGSYAAGNLLLQHLLSLDKILTTVTAMTTKGSEVPQACMTHPGDCISKN